MGPTQLCQWLLKECGCDYQEDIDKVKGEAFIFKTLVTSSLNHSRPCLVATHCIAKIDLDSISAFSCVVFMSNDRYL